MFYYWPSDPFVGGAFVTYRLTLDGLGSESDWMVPGTEIEFEEEPD